MKSNIRPPEFDTETDAGEEAYLKFMNSIGIADWRDNPLTVLGVVDRLLRPHGLEVHIFRSDSDQYEFDIKAKES